MTDAASKPVCRVSLESAESPFLTPGKLGLMLACAQDFDAIHMKEIMTDIINTFSDVKRALYKDFIARFLMEEGSGYDYEDLAKEVVLESPCS